VIKMMVKKPTAQWTCKSQKVKCTLVSLLHILLKVLSSVQRGKSLYCVPSIKLPSSTA